MFHQVISQLKTSVHEEEEDCDEKKSRRMSYVVREGGNGESCSHESNSSSYRPFSETPDIFKALPTSNFYYAYQPDEQSMKSLTVLQLDMQDGLGINPLSLACGPRVTSDHPSSSAAAGVTTSRFSRLSTLALCPQNMVSMTPSPSFFPTELPHPHPGLMSLDEEPPFETPDPRLTLTSDDEMWNQFQGSVDSTLRHKYLKTPEKRMERREGSWNKERLSLLISSMIPARRRVFASVYSQSLSSQSSVTQDPAILGKRSARQKTDSCVSCSTSLVTLFLVILLLIASLALARILRLESLWGSRSDDASSHFQDLRQGWWQEAIFYEVFPASFRDSDSDGFGDLNGIREKVAYIKDLGVTGLRLNSLFTAMDYPHQYDHVTDFKSVDPHIGSLNDFKSLVHLLHQHRLTVVLDLNPSVTSDQHHWATQWLSNKSSAFSSFYVINSESVCHTCCPLPHSPRESTSSSICVSCTSTTRALFLLFFFHIH